MTGEEEPCLEVGFLHAPLMALGPGRRVGLWLRGCERDCPGCVSPDLQAAAPETRRPVQELFAEIEGLWRETQAAGLTISGGEPFQQAVGLRALLTLTRWAGLTDVLIYSGFLVRDLLAAYPWLPLLAAAVVDGPYERDRPSLAPWRGSAGQALTVFQSSLAETYAQWQLDSARKSQIILSESGTIRFLGIPAPGDADRLKQKLKKLDHHGQR